MTAVIIVLLVLALLYLFAIMPRMTGRPDASALMGRYYAHRGLHDNASDAPENSLLSFKKAVDAGYGIEFDVQLTRDRIPVVFHDESLVRVCGVSGNVRDYTLAELSQFKLMNSGERIPTLRQALDTVGGRVPLIIEIKIHEDVDAVCAKADELIAAYKGPYCIESFDPRAVRWYKRHRPQVVRGQLSSDFNTKTHKQTFSEFLVHHLLTNAICRPDFIAYNHNDRDNLSRRLCRSLFGALSVAWTIRSQEQLDASRNSFDLFIFERFIPEERKG